jgi:hypothetical protein
MKGRPFGWFRLAWQKILLAVTDDTVDPAESSFSFDDYDITANSSSTATGSIVARNAAGDPLSGKTAVLAIETIAVSAANGIVTATAEIADDGTDRAYVTVTVKDASGRGIPDIPAADVVIAVSGTGNTVTQPTGVTNQAGVISTGYFVSTVAATKTVSATVRSTAITDTASTVVTGTPAAGAFNNEPVGFTQVATWNDETTLTATGVTLDTTGWAQDDGSILGTLTFSNAGHTISSSTAGTPWGTFGVSAGYYLRVEGSTSNDGYYAVTAVSGQDVTVRETTTSESIGSLTVSRGWGDKTVVTTGPTGTPSIGGTHFIQTYYPGGVHGGHDAHSIHINITGTPDELFAAFEAQWASDNPTSNSGGGNKHLIVMFTGGSRFIVNFDDGLAAGTWTIYGGTSGSAEWYPTGTVAATLGAWIVGELYLKKPTGPSTTDGILRLWIDDTLALERTDLQYGAAVGDDFPTGDFDEAYWDASNNGNHTTDHPTGQRYIGVNAGTEDQESRSWLAVLYASVP